MENQAYSTWLEIDLDAIKNNIALVKKQTGTQVMAIVKANGYGHGALGVAKAAERAGAKWCGVARIEEALNLRASGINTQIMVLGYTPPEMIPEAIENDIHVAIYDTLMAKSFAAFAKNMQKKLRAHLKVETGMGRLGMMPAQVMDFVADFLHHPAIILDGIFTHFARADEPEANSVPQQLLVFSQVLTDLRRVGFSPEVVHAANSAAIFNYPEAHFDLVRPGIAIYGLTPSPKLSLPDNFQPALTWKARLTSVRTLPAGHGVSYGANYVTSKEERIGVIPVGYGDGFRRVPGQQAIVRGKRVAIVGSICMDQCMLQLDSVPEAVPGDEVVLLGKQGAQQITADDLATRWGTLNYEVVCGLADRLPRIYHES